MENQEIINKLIEKFYNEEKPVWFLTFFNDAPICNIDESIPAIQNMFSNKLPIKDREGIIITYDAMIAKKDDGSFVLILRYGNDDYYPLASFNYVPFICNIEELLKSDRVKEVTDNV